VPFYTLTVFLNGFLTGVLGYSIKDALLISTLSMILLMLLVVPTAALSDGWGRKRMLMATAVVYFVASYPLFWLMTQPGFLSPLMAVMLLTVIVGFYIGAAPTVFVELFPTSSKWFMRDQTNFPIPQDARYRGGRNTREVDRGLRHGRASHRPEAGYAPCLGAHRQASDRTWPSAAKNSFDTPFERYQKVSPVGRGYEGRNVKPIETMVARKLCARSRSRHEHYPARIIAAILVHRYCRMSATISATTVLFYPQAIS
jgi:hypothetical protein